MYKGSILILGFNLECPDNDVVAMNYKTIQNQFPTEIDLCGLIKFGSCTDAEAHLSEIIADVDVTDNPILLTCDTGCENLKAFLFKNGKLEEAEYEVMSEEELHKSFSFVRLRFDMREYVDDQSRIPEILQERRKYVSEAKDIVRTAFIYPLFLLFQLAFGRLCFTFKGTDIKLTAGSSGISTTAAEKDMKIADLLPKTKGSSRNQFPVIDVEALIKRTPHDNKGRHYLQMKYVQSEDDKGPVEVPIRVDSMSFLYNTTEILSLYDILVESVCRNLRLVESCLVHEREEFQRVSTPQPYHFLLPEFGHFLTCVYPKAVDDDRPYLVERRKSIHDILGLLKNRPLFRRTSAWTEPASQSDTSSVLTNTHEGLKQTVVGGRQYLVQGTYGYHHYMQDQFDDNGWGCAYRSLQTLVSWFRHQAYTTKSIPTHKQIQEILVRLGDKPREFVGSRQWIGSAEVAMVIQSYLGVDSRILNVRTGSEMAQLGPDLSMHFTSQGTPIMIGGGVLAHTILGIDHNAETQELKFLILDPHYTGAEDLQTIQSKGWCSWKGINFWDKKAYYNLCMPIKPAMI